MADVKWIKIVTDIFDDGKMFAIESLPDGQLIELVWFKVLCLAGKCNNNGFLTINDKIPYTDEMLSSIFRMELGTIKRALETFENLKMIEVVDNAYMVSNWLLHQSGDRLDEIKEQNRLRQAKHREKQKLIESNVTNNVTDNVTNNVNCSISISYSKSNSNSNNYLSILPNYMYREYIEKREELNRCIKEWFEYKDNKKPKSSNHYDSELGMTKLLNQFVKNSEKYGTDKVIEIVDFSMSNNYQGIFWEKLENNKPVNSKGSDYMNAIKNRIDIVDEWIGGKNDTTGVW